MRTLEEYNTETRELVAEMKLLDLRRMVAMCRMEAAKLQRRRVQARLDQLLKDFHGESSEQPSLS